MMLLLRRREMGVGDIDQGTFARAGGGWLGDRLWNGRRAKSLGRQRVSRRKKGVVIVTG